MNQSLITFLETLAQCRKLLSSIKITLVHSEGFKLGQLYSSIDIPKSGKISPNDLYLYLLKKEIRTTESEMFSVFKELDRKKLGLITAHDLSDYFAENSSYTMFQRSSTEDTESIVLKFFNQIIENNRVLEKARVQLSNYKVADVFQMLDPTRGGMLTLEDIRSFMSSEGCTEQIITEVYQYLSERGMVVITLQTFQSLIQPFQKPQPISVPVKTPTFNEISSSNHLWQKQQVNQQIQVTTNNDDFKSTIGRLSLNSQQPFNIDDFLSKKVEENKVRRQYIEDHQKKRQDYVEEIMKRRNRPMSSISSLQPIKTEFQDTTPPISQISSPKNLRSKLNDSLSKISSYKRSVKDIQSQLQDKLKSFRREESSNRTSPDVSFSLSQTLSKVGSGDLNSIIMKQQRELELERSRRIQAENEVVNYKKQLKQLTMKMQSPSTPSLFKPLSGNLSPKVGYISKNLKSPRHEEYLKGQSGYVHRSFKYPGAGERVEKRLRDKEREKENGSIGHLEYELMKNRLDMEFNSYKRMKEINSGLFLYR